VTRRVALGIDVGGTNIKSGLVAEDGTVLARSSVPTPAHDPEAMMRTLRTVGDKMLAEARAHDYRVLGVGLGLPGARDETGETALFTNNVPSLHGLPLRSTLSAAWGLPVLLDQDCQMATMGEARFGSGRGSRRFLCAVLGTGIGVGAMIDGQVLRISYGYLGELGHIVVAPEDIPCTCGGRGCLEAVAAAPALERQARALAEEGRSPFLADVLRRRGCVTAADLADAARAGDAAAQAVWEQEGHYLGVAVVSWAYIFTPDTIAFAGGPARAGELLLAPIRAKVAAIGSPFFVGNLRIVPAELGDRAGMIGAAVSVMS
jgi:glucokinase